MSFPTEFQQEFLVCGGDVIVLGGPGSGKTTCAALKAADFLSSTNLYDRALFLSFSRSAVRQVTLAMRQKLLRPIPSYIRNRIDIKTYHSFALGLVKSYGAYLGIKKPITPIMDAEIRLRWPHDPPETSSKELWDLACTEGFLHIPSFAISKATKVLEGIPIASELLGRLYPLVIVDEVQDTSDEEWWLIERLAMNSRLICLGDLEQRIYDNLPGKRIDHQRIEKIIAIRSGIRKIVFPNESKRQPPDSPILAVAKGFRDNLIPNSPNVAKTFSILKIQYFKDLVCLAKLKATHCEGNVCVLVYENDEVSRVSKYFWNPKNVVKWCLPCLDYADSVEMIALERAWASLLAYHQNSTMEKNIYRNALAALLGILSKAKSTRNIVKVLTESGFSPTKETAKIIEILDKLEKPPQKNLALTRHLWLRLMDLGKLIKPLSTLLNKVGEELVLREYEAVLKLVNHHGSESTLAQWERGIQQRYFLESQKSPYRVHIMTYHKAKGREYDHVILLDDPAFTRIEEKRMQEFLNLIYVAITRARKTVNILSPFTGTSLLFQRLITTVHEADRSIKPQSLNDLFRLLK